MTLERKIGKILQDRSLTLGLAESCTGGLVASRITDVPGSSAYFMAGFVTYSNEAKTKFLSVPDTIIARHGAVSNIVAERMAKGVRAAAGVHISVSITGIAGPEGGSPEKPVGTVFIGLATKKEVFVRKFLFTGNRREVRKCSSEEALTMLYDYLEGRLA
jgi:nicotinamide-nucleotide amidase